MESRVQVASPWADLRPFVANYRYRVGSFAPDSSPLIFPSRTAQFLEFYLGDPIRVKQEGLVEDVPRIALVGTQAVRRLELFMGAKIQTFTVTFHPTGFYRLFGIPLADLAGKGVPAIDLLGLPVENLYQQLGDCTNFDSMTEAANIWLRSFAARAHPDLADRYRPVEDSLKSIALGPTPFAIDDLVSASMVGQRHFERIFKQATGVAPKRYLRVMRLNHALDMKRMTPHLSWSKIAAELGYFDQMHLVHDFKALGGESPSSLLTSTAKAGDNVGFLLGVGPRR
ncbi:MAG: helix-turn-helix domain-containing protein [Fimbriimonas sp.]